MATRIVSRKPSGFFFCKIKNRSFRGRLPEQVDQDDQRDQENGGIHIGLLELSQSLGCFQGWRAINTHQRVGDNWRSFSEPRIALILMPWTRISILIVVVHLLSSLLILGKIITYFSSLVNRSML